MDPYLSHGKWTEAEKQAFEQAVAFFMSRNWQEISEYVGTRTAMQCKERYENKHLNPEKYKNWTAEEDRQLLEACVAHNKHWSRIAALEFPQRSDHSLLFRFNKLMEWRAQNEWLLAQPEHVRQFIMLLYGRPRNRKQTQSQQQQPPPQPIISEEPALYTSSGELVPTQPKFPTSAAQSSALFATADAEKHELIGMFMEKLRIGDFDIHLLTRLGLSQPLINRLAVRSRRGGGGAKKSTKETTKKREKRKQPALPPPGLSFSRQADDKNNNDFGNLSLDSADLLEFTVIENNCTINMNNINNNNNNINNNTQKFGDLSGRRVYKKRNLENRKQEKKEPKVAAEATSSHLVNVENIKTQPRRARSMKSKGFI